MGGGQVQGLLVQPFQLLTQRLKQEGNQCQKLRLSFVPYKPYRVYCINRSRLAQATTYHGLGLRNAEHFALLGDVLQLLCGPAPLFLFLQPLGLSGLNLGIQSITFLAILGEEAARLEEGAVGATLGFPLPLRRGEPPRRHWRDRRDRRGDGGRLLPLRVDFPGGPRKSRGLVGIGDPVLDSVFLLDFFKLGQVPQDIRS